MDIKEVNYCGFDKNYLACKDISIECIIKSNIKCAIIIQSIYEISDIFETMLVVISQAGLSGFIKNCDYDKAIIYFKNLSEIIFIVRNKFNKRLYYNKFTCIWVSTFNKIDDFYNDKYSFMLRDFGKLIKTF